jgi:hypothetical protein
MRTIRRAGWHSPELQSLPERPFRTLPAGSLGDGAEPVPVTLTPYSVLFCVTVKRDAKRCFVGTESEESECVGNRGEATPCSASSQDVRCRQVDDSEKLLIYGDEEARNPAVLFVVPPQF